MIKDDQQNLQCMESALNPTSTVSSLRWKLEEDQGSKVGNSNKARDNSRCFVSYGLWL